MTNAILRPALTKLLLTAALALPLAACLCPESDDWNATADHQSYQPPPRYETGGTPTYNWPAYETAGATGTDAGALPSAHDGAAGSTGADAGALPSSDGGTAGVTGSTMAGGGGVSGTGGPAGATGTTSAGGAGGSCGPDAGAPATAPVCQFDNQCGTNARCRNGACERACTSSLTCGTGQTCTGGYCRTQPTTTTTTTTTNGACLYDAECGASSTCINGVCHARCQAGATCASAADHCVDGVCQPDVGPRPQCHGATDCAAGRACVNAVCRTACTGDVDCCAGTSGVYCRGGVCVTAHEAAPQCRLANQCGAGADCVDGVCGG
jgi:hypothetical protein